MTQAFEILWIQV